jgi:hypothetical protein
MLEKNSPDSPWMMFYFLRADALPNLTDVSGRMVQAKKSRTFILRGHMSGLEE